MMAGEPRIGFEHGKKSARRIVSTSVSSRAVAFAVQASVEQRDLAEGIARFLGDRVNSLPASLPIRSGSDPRRAIEGVGSSPA
jgi:hypothetical protein